MGNNNSTPMDSFEELMAKFCRNKCLLEPEYTFGTHQQDRRTPHELFVGEPQGGKSNVIALKAISLAILDRRDVVIVCRNCSHDPDQLKRSTFDELRKAFNAFAQTQGVRTQLKKQYRWPRILLTEDAATMQSLAEHREAPGNVGRIFVTIYERHHLDRVLDVVEGEDAAPFHLIVDEADKLAYGAGGPVGQQLEVLQDTARSVSFFTATAHEVMRDERFLCCALYALPRHADYKGFDHLNWVEIPHKKKNTRRDTSDASASPLERDPDLWRIVLARECDDDLLENGQPRIGLIKTETVQENQMKLADDIHAKMPDQFLTIVFNSKHIVVQCGSLTEAIVQALKDCKIKSKVKNGHSITISRTSIRDVLNAVRTLFEGDWSVIRPILIISDVVSQRGMHLRDGDYKWHLTFEVLRACKTTTVPSLMQDLRILGINKDDVPLTLYCDKELHQQLKTEFMFHREVVARAQARPNHVPLSQAVKEMPVDMRKMTDRAQLRGREKRLPVRLTAPLPDGSAADGGFSLADYGIAPPPPPVARPVTQDAAAAASGGATGVPDMNEAEFHHLTTKMFPKWARPDNRHKIAKFLQSIHFDQTFASLDDFKTYCRGFDITADHFMKPRGKWSFGMLFVVMPQGHVALHPRIRAPFEKDFC